MKLWNCVLFSYEEGNKSCFSYNIVLLFNTHNKQQLDATLDHMITIQSKYIWDNNLGNDLPHLSTEEQLEDDNGLLEVVNGRRSGSAIVMVRRNKDKNKGPQNTTQET